MIDQATITRFVKDPATRLSSKDSQEAYMKTLRAFAHEHPQKVLGQVTERDLVHWLNRPSIAPGTRSAYRARLEAFFGWAQAQGLAPANPAGNLKRALPTTAKRVVKGRWLDLESINRVLDQVDTSTPYGRRNAVVFRLGFAVGLRRAEIVGLRWNQVDFDRQEITLVGKGQKLAVVFVPAQTLEALRLWRADVEAGLGRAPIGEPIVCRFASRTRFDGSGTVVLPLFDQSVTTETVRRLCEEASLVSGVEFRPHDMRRSFAGLMDDKVGIEGTSAALRHSNLGTTQRYLESRQDAAALAGRKAGLDL